MNIGIIEAGHIGSAIGALWARAGHSVLFSFSRDAEKSARTAAQAGPNARTDTPREAANFGEAVLLCAAPQALDDALHKAGSSGGSLYSSLV
jgi:hypothetical protein